MIPILITKSQKKEKKDFFKTLYQLFRPQMWFGLC